MKKLILILLFFTGFLQAQTLQSPTYNKTTTNDLISKASIKVDLPVLNSSFISPNFATDLQQGYAFDGTNHYLIGTSKISKRDASYNVIIENNTALTGITGVNHLGDGVYLTGFLYIPVETYPAVTGMQIAKYNATTLALDAVYDISAQGHECSAITTDGTTLYITSFLDGTKIWKYSLTGTFLGIINITTPFINGIQGISYYSGDFYISEQTRISKLNLAGTVNTFLGYVPGVVANIHRGEGIENVAGVIRVSVLGFTSSNIYYLTSSTTNSNVFNTDIFNWSTSLTTDFTKKFSEVNTDYSLVGNGDMTFGSRGLGTIPMIATRTNSTTSTGFFNLAMQSADANRTADADMVFRTGLETGTNSISNLTSSGTAFLFSNGTSNLMSINRQGSALITGLATTGNRLQVSGTTNSLSGFARGLLVNTAQVATANSDQMIAVDIAPTFTNGALTGVDNVGLRVSGSFNQSRAIFSRNTLTTGQSGFISNDDTGGRFMEIGVANSAISSGASYALAGEAFMRGSGGTTGLHISSSNATAPVRFSTNNGVEKMRIYGSSGNVSLQSGGTFTDNGVDRLQVAGTASGTVDATLSNQFPRYGQITSLDANNVKTTGNQNVAGDKTFTSLFTSVKQLRPETISFLNNISVASVTSPTITRKSDKIAIFGDIGGSASGALLSTSNLTADRLFEFPNASGTLALTSDITSAVTGAITNTNTSASTLTLSVTSPLVSYYVFTGTTATWTLPIPAGNTTKKLSLINTGSGTVTVNTNAGANVLYNSGSTTNTYSLLMGSGVELYSDGSRWIVL